MARPHLLILLVAFLASLGALAGCRAAPAASANGTATVVSVTDGDTIDVDFGGHVEPVRLLGIDTPETHHPTKPVQCYGAEASARTADLLPVGSQVTLVRDVEARDRYDRLLAYVYRAEDDLFVNLSLVTDGYADTLAIAPNDAHTVELSAARNEARVAGAGLWSTCGGPGVPVG